MRKIFIIVSFLLLNIAHTGDCLAENAVLAGRITLQNSGGKPLGGVQVSARKATPTASRSNGHFDLVFQDKKPGDRVWLALEKNGYEVVNRDSLKVVIRANPDDIVVFVMCTEGERDRHALIYYEIAQDNINKRYVQEIKRVNDNYEKTLKEKNDELEKLKMQRDAALAQAKDLAEKFAEANLDEASEMYKQAFKLFREGKVKDALKVLDDEKMDRAMAKAQKIKQEAEKEIGKGVENYMLKARLCITDFRFDEAEKNFQKAVQAGPDDYDNIFEFALYLQKQNQYVRALPLYENALSIAEKKQDKDGEATTLNNLGVLYRNSNDYPAAAKAYKRSLEIREKLAKDNPDTYLPDVANTLNNMGIFYWSSNDYPAAAKAYKNSMEIKEKLAEDNPDTYLPNVAMTLNNLGVLYNDSNDYPAATKAYKRSLEIREKLAEDNPDTYLPDVAATLNNLGILH
ncbi:MAG: tetratricopeptide repeat protein, partial [Desulfobacterales bacterium]|nr:tetratricopeptide repeat protein [Desulfobacterales bacterium]